MIKEYEQQRYKERETLAVFAGCRPHCTMWIPEKFVKRKEWSYKDLVGVGYLTIVPDDPDQQDKKGFQVTYKGEMVLNILSNIMGSYIALQVDIDDSII